MDQWTFLIWKTSILNSKEETKATTDWQKVRRGSLDKKIVEKRRSRSRVEGIKGIKGW